MSTLHTLDPFPQGCPSVLLLHGLGADSNSWALQMPALGEAGYRPIAPDMPGFGLSPYDGRGWTVRRVAAQMSELVEALETGPLHVIGISMGGVIAQQFVLDFPHLTQKMVLVSTFSALRPKSFTGWLYFLRRFILVNTLGLEAQARFVAERLFPEAQHAPLRDMFVESIAQADERAYRRAMLALGIFDSRKRLSEIDCETLVVTGRLDTTVEPGRQEELACQIPSARWVVIRDAGHAVTVDQADKFNRILLSFLSSKQPHKV